MIIQLLVISGVGAMSLTKCDVLQNAAEDNGAVVYVFGNFALHYWPFVGVILRATTPRAYANQATVAVQTFLVYCAVKKPNNVYGCPMPYNIVVASGYAGGTIATLLMERHAYVTHHWKPF